MDRPVEIVRHSRGEAGYNLVFLMVSLTLLNILIAVALPKWSQAIQREKEEELISRGWQYAEAIRVFQNRFQRLPVRLEELIEVEPRSIRKLWKDPMTDSGRWVLIPPGQGPTLTVRETGPDGDGRNDPEEEEPAEDEEPSEELDPDTGIGEKKGVVQVGPFVGVHSRSSKTSILVFNGRDRYDQWHFTVDVLLGQGAGVPPNRPPGVPPGGPPGGPPVLGGDPAASRGLQLSTRWLGRPLPEFLTPPQGALPQDGQLPDGKPLRSSPRGMGGGRR